jgi:hypothetical protein
LQKLAPAKARAPDYPPVESTICRA